MVNSVTGKLSKARLATCLQRGTQHTMQEHGGKNARKQLTNQVEDPTVRDMGKYISGLPG